MNWREINERCYTANGGRDRHYTVERIDDHYDWEEEQPERWTATLYICPSPLVEPPDFGLYGKNPNGIIKGVPLKSSETMKEAIERCEQLHKRILDNVNS